MGQQSLQMGKPTVYIQFKNFWDGFDMEHFRRCFPFLFNKYEFVESAKPDFILYHRNPKKVEGITTICWNPENHAPDMNKCDFYIGSLWEYADAHDNYFRIPAYLPRMYYHGFTPEDLIRPLVPDEIPPNFCNFLYSAQVPVRNRFYIEMSIRFEDRIDAPGICASNHPPIGGTVNDKLNFQSRYKFTIAHENSQVNGYVTEKLVESMLINSVPVYVGAPDVSRDGFNHVSFINATGLPYEQVAEKIKHYHENDEAYQELRAIPWFLNNKVPDLLSEERTLEIFERILE